MPYKQEWVPADMFTRHNGVGIYHTYKNDEIENGANTYWFVTDPYATIDDAFDVRDLPIVGGLKDPAIPLTYAIVVTLQGAIDAGILTAEGVKEVTR